MKRCASLVKNTEKRIENSAFKSLFLTSLFCLAIAILTFFIWSGPFIEHLLISFGYGYSAVFSALIISYFRPDLGIQWVNAFSLTLSMILGTCNAAFLLEGYSNFDSLPELKPVILLGFIFTVICFFYFYIYEQKLLTQKELETTKRKQAEQEKALVMSQLKQLQSQIEPHFLFNTLANINALIDSQPKDARRMLEKLTDLLRGTLKSNRQSNTSLVGELELVDAYLSIQKIRLGDRLTYHIDNQLTNDVVFPPLLIQPLVENAIQHGIEPKAAGGSVTVLVVKEQSMVSISVIDNGIGLMLESKNAGHGIGLENIRQRMKVLFSDEANFAIVENKQGGVTAKLQIKLTDLELLQR
ncbi:sensor histidine kinase [Vibrio genomosp. F10 str. 9ZC157]|uniref:ATPase n=1 Tax=Vibrio genomosp. F10 str. ZF-129 TaxID=1187848 RepID=A0A1E5BAA7_9VIBR|nr:histidine kinase [Vibrio genomosp. F10]OEE30858.1 ATPase [Vibrio genomosp. F10 str. ZF-129]OEE98053.1 ATPase [Vibrio genomosp. F10 str. 9ZC157]